MDKIEALIQGKELVYEDQNDIVKISFEGGQIQKTVTYKKDWIDNNGQKVKAGDVVQITGDEAKAGLVYDMQYLKHFNVQESGRDFSGEEQNKNKESLSEILLLLEGKELVYEDEHDIVEFSAVDGQIQQTITYKENWENNKGQQVKAGDIVHVTGNEAKLEFLNAMNYLEYFKIKDIVKEFSENSKLSDIMEKKDSKEIITIEESKYAQIYGKAKGIIKEVFSKIKSFLNIKSNDRNDKTNDETIK